MASDIEIARLAATRMGTGAAIASLNDNSVLARTLKGVWDAERKATLRDSSFNFATQTFSLPALNPATLDGGAVPAPWSMAYAMPAGSLRLLELLDDAAHGSYELQSDGHNGMVILCAAQAPLSVRVVVDRPIAVFDAAAADAFALRLAWRCGRRIAGSAFDAQACWGEYQQALARAKSTDAKENPPIDQEESDWITARQTGHW